MRNNPYLACLIGNRFIRRDFSRRYAQCRRRGVGIRRTSRVLGVTVVHLWTPPTWEVICYSLRFCALSSTAVRKLVKTGRQCKGFNSLIIPSVGMWRTAALRQYNNTATVTCRYVLFWEAYSPVQSSLSTCLPPLCLCLSVSLSLCLSPPPPSLSLSPSLPLSLSPLSLPPLSPLSLPPLSPLSIFMFVSPSLCVSPLPQSLSQPFCLYPCFVLLTQTFYDRTCERLKTKAWSTPKDTLNDVF